MVTKPKSESRAASISLLGGVLCLDFANTVDWRTSTRPEEILTSYGDLVDWSRHVGIVDGRRGGRLKRSAALHAGAAGPAFEDVIQSPGAISQCIGDP